MKTKLRIIMILLTFISKNTFSKKLVTSPRKLDAGIKDRFKKSIATPEPKAQPMNLLDHP